MKAIGNQKPCGAVEWQLETWQPVHREPTSFTHSLLLNTSFVLDQVLVWKSMKMNEIQSLMNAEANGEDRYLWDNRNPVV